MFTFSNLSVGFVMLIKRLAVLPTGTSSNATIDLGENGASTTEVGSRAAVILRAFFTRVGVTTTYKGETKEC